MALRMFSSLCSLAGLLILGACERSPDAAPANETNPSTYRDSVVLLHRLLGEEQHLSKVLLVKKESDALEEVVKQISSTAAEHVAALEKIAEQSGLDLNADVLPAGETATRDAISKTKRDALLKSSGAEFEFQVLLTQVEALNYGAHLAVVASDHARNPDEAAAFLRIRSDLQELYELTIRQLRAALHSAPAE